MGIMKIQIQSHKFQRPNSRAHFILFSEESPYKPKVVKRKDVYKRKAKHKKSIQDD